MVSIATKRIYEVPDPADGARILVDRLWPRGIKKDEAHLASWNKGVAPSNELRRWYSHQTPKWPEFRRRYLGELNANPAAAELRQEIFDATHKTQRVTLVYGAKDSERNNAVVLAEFLRRRKADRA